MAGGWLVAGGSGSCRGSGRQDEESNTEEGRTSHSRGKLIMKSRMRRLRSHMGR